MALHPEVKQLRKEKRALERLVFNRDIEIGQKNQHIRRLKQYYYEEFVEPRENKLEIRELSVLRMRFGVNNDWKGLSFEEIGRFHNITRERIRQIEGKAIAKINYKK